MSDLPYSEMGAARPEDPALLLRIEQDGRNSMQGCMEPADIPALLRKIAANIEAQLPAAACLEIHHGMTRPHTTAECPTGGADDE